MCQRVISDHLDVEGVGSCVAETELCREVEPDVCSKSIISF